MCVCMFFFHLFFVFWLQHYGPNVTKIGIHLTGFKSIYSWCIYQKVSLGVETFQNQWNVNYILTVYFFNCMKIQCRTATMLYIIIKYITKHTIGWSRQYLCTTSPTTICKPSKTFLEFIHNAQAPVDNYYTAKKYILHHNYQHGILIQFNYFQDPIALYELSLTMLPCLRLQ